MLCTVDSCDCDSNTCQFNHINCYGNPCTDDFCVDGECVYYVVCDDNNVCTDDTAPFPNLVKKMDPILAAFFTLVKSLMDEGEIDVDPSLIQRSFQIFL